MNQTDNSPQSSDEQQMILEKYKEDIKFLHYSIKDKGLTPDEILAREDVFTNQAKHRLTQRELLSRIEENNEALADFHPHYLILNGKREHLTETGQAILDELTSRLKYHEDRIAQLESQLEGIKQDERQESS